MELANKNRLLFAILTYQYFGHLCTLAVPGKYILALWQYFKIILFQITNKALT